MYTLRSKRLTEVMAKNNRFPGQAGGQNERLARERLLKLLLMTTALRIGCRTELILFYVASHNGSIAAQDSLMPRFLQFF
jgi:hypothetical protein